MPKALKRGSAWCQRHRSRAGGAGGRPRRASKRGWGDAKGPEAGLGGGGGAELCRSSGRAEEGARGAGGAEPAPPSPLPAATGASASSTHAAILGGWWWGGGNGTGHDTDNRASGHRSAPAPPGPAPCGRDQRGGAWPGHGAGAGRRLPSDSVLTTARGAGAARLDRRGGPGVGSRGGKRGKGVRGTAGEGPGGIGGGGGNRGGGRESGRQGPSATAHPALAGQPPRRRS